jgi:nucleotidyltransferase substrate binding protein (TIGR01987 family)
MSSSSIDLSPLRKALAQLSEALVFWHTRAEGDALKPHLRSAVIQSFEFTYELAVRSTRRVLIERAESSDLVSDLSFNDLLRRALDAGLPMQLDTWRHWRDMRNATSHAYDEDRANEVALAAADFVADVTLLLKALEA